MVAGPEHETDRAIAVAAAASRLDDTRWDESTKVKAEVVRMGVGWDDVVKAVR